MRYFPSKKLTITMILFSFIVILLLRIDNFKYFFSSTIDAETELEDPLYAYCEKKIKQNKLSFFNSDLLTSVLEEPSATITEEPTQTEESATPTEEQSTIATEEPTQTAEEPATLTEEQSTEEPPQTAEEPATLTEEQSTEEPTQTAEEPATLTEEQSTEEPTQTEDPAATITEEPTQTEEPATIATEEPATLTEDQSTEEPTQTEDPAATITEEPTQTAEEPFNYSVAECEEYIENFNKPKDIEVPIEPPPITTTELSNAIIQNSITTSQIEENHALENQEQWGGTNELTTKKIKHTFKERSKTNKENLYIEKKLKTRKEFVENFLKETGTENHAQEVSKDVFYMTPDFFSSLEENDEFLSTNGITIEPENTSEFQIILNEKVTLEMENSFFIYILFSHDIQYENFTLASIQMTDKNNTITTPKKVFIGNREAILIFNTSSLDSHLILLNNIQQKEEKTGITPSILNGYISLLTNPDDYISLTSTINNTYEAVIEDSINFQTSKLSFGKFDQYDNSNSTLAVELSNTSNLNEKCAVLIFGNDMSVDNGNDIMPINNLSIMPKSAGTIPIDQQTIENYSSQKQKQFLGFIYFDNMETSANGKKTFYLSIEKNSELQKGRYSSVMSFETFCPEN